VFVLEANEDEFGRPYIAMELMVGDTLQDLVDRSGPLAVGDAVAKILDIIEGLREAHRLGLIHRDVKPSNGFLDGDGRAKIGDFGLSKSQVGTASLTRTGSFLGTPLYASPEQIRVEPLDERTDVYSVAATLFFLLTGRAPFDRGDAAATMARIVSDPAPSATEKRPEVPRGLDRIIRKGLERDRDRRFRDLGELREALLPYCPGQTTEAGLTIRVGAYLFDYALMFFALFLPAQLITSRWAELAIYLAVTVVYFTVGDGLFGGSIGKRLLRLRVTRAEGNELAGLGRCSLRLMVFIPLADLPISLLLRDGPWRTPLLWQGVCIGLEVLGLAILASTFRKGSGLRALHDRVAGTRVVGLHHVERRKTAGARRAIGRDRGSVTRPTGVIQSVGPYKVRGAVRWESDRRVLSGEDSHLGRETWIVLRPRGSPPPAPARREIARPTRSRWLAGGEQAEGRWDAYIAPAGCPISDLAGPEGLPWRDARPILEDLADELAASIAEGTLPPGLTPDQVWIQPDGRALMVDSLAVVSDADRDLSDDARALALLRKTAALALEGGRRRFDDNGPIRSAAPLHASKMLAQLTPGPDAHATVQDFRAALDRTRQLPTEVGMAQRAMQLGFLAFTISIPLTVSYYGVAWQILRNFEEPGESLLSPADRAWINLLDMLVFGAVPPAIWVLWDGLTRGGLSFRLAGLALAREDGRRADRWRCAWRSFLVWLPPTALLVGSVAAHGYVPRSPLLALTLYGLAIAVLPIYAGIALLDRQRGPHGWLSRTWVVPR
jgi:uncharacterized RDD family membrane protein YckC